MKFINRLNIIKKSLYLYYCRIIGKQTDNKVITHHKFTLDDNFINRLIEDTKNNKRYWTIIGGEYVHKSVNFHVSLGIKKEYVSGDDKVTIMVYVPGHGTDMISIYHEDELWVVVNQLKYAIVNKLTSYCNNVH